VTLVSDPEQAVSEGATWIIRAELAQGKTLLRDDILRLVSSIDDITAWQAQLHICQSISHIAVPEEAVPAVEVWLETLLSAPRPFLRAWAIDALCHVRGASGKTDALLKRMENDKAASVRARVRNLKRVFG